MTVTLLLVGVVAREQREHDKYHDHSSRGISNRSEPNNGAALHYVLPVPKNPNRSTPTAGPRWPSGARR